MTDHRTHDTAGTTRRTIDEWHRHWHAHHGAHVPRRVRRLRRALRRSPEGSLAALEAYRRDVEEHLADVSEEIRRRRDHQSAPSAR
ncbi:MAG TPA: hypothetical protein VFZ83_03815 [Acidimicrobiia bacterium]|nr:hypothetical protein [Acidimicrobiia bacterium]